MNDGAEGGPDGGRRSFAARSPRERARLSRTGATLLNRVATLIKERPAIAFLLRVLHRYLALDGTQRALVIAGQAFSALIPLLIVVATVVSSSGGRQIADSLSARFRLSGNASDAVMTLFAQPPNAAQTITAGSAILLVVSGLSFSRSLQRTYEVAWQLPPRGARGSASGVAALMLLLSEIVLLSLLAGFFRSVPAGSAALFVVRACASSALWLALQHLFLAGRVGWRRLLPGAVVAGVGQQVVAALSTLWIPSVIENNATRYGAIGVSFALLSWLVLISVVMVVAAAVSVELGGGPALPRGEGQSTKLLGTLARLLGADDVPASDAPESAVGASRADRPAGDPPGDGGGRPGPSDMEGRHG